MAYEIESCEVAVAQLRPGTGDQTPIVSLALGNPDKPTETIYGDLFLNGLSRDQARAALAVGTRFTAGLRVFEAEAALNAEGKPMVTKSGSPILNRNIQLLSKPVDISRPPSLLDMFGVHAVEANAEQHPQF